MIPLADIVASGLCIGCGLCHSIAPDAVEIRLTADGEERPVATAPLPNRALELINRVCPGLRVELAPAGVPVDPMWGPVLRLARGYAADPAVRFEAATGGVLSALGRYLLETERVARVLHAAPRPDDPLYWEAKVSTAPDQIMAGSGSRYGPAAPLTPLMQLLDDATPLALVAKPCDAAAVRNLVIERPGYGNAVRYILTLACGGASKMTKTWSLLDDFGVAREEVATLRHRGHGNPGPTVVTTRDGRRYETTYLSMWEDEGTWDLQWRCKVCPDGMGEVADLVALDCWPGGAPVGDDDGFNGIIARTPAGAELLAAAIADGALVLVDDGLPVAETLESWQPHQSRRKAAVPARLRAMAEAGLPVLEAPGLRLEEAEARLDAADRRRELEGARRRLASDGRRAGLCDV